MSQLLSISGNPGCGKTVISAYLLDGLDNELKDTDVRVAYFFCDDKEETQKSAQSLLCGLIHQLVTKTPNLIKRPMLGHVAFGPKMLESLDVLWQVFVSIATDTLSNGIYVLDALDECEKSSRDDLLQRLSSYFLPESKTTVNTYIKVLITIRPYQEIPILLLKNQNIRLKTESEGRNSNANITSLINHKVDELADICRYDSGLKEMVRAKLNSGADGMFLWVSLIVKALLDTPTSLVSETLEATPDSINGLYSHLLSRLDGRRVGLARDILIWVVTAPQPMSVVELAIACSIKITHESESSIETAIIGDSSKTFRCAA